MFFPKRHRLSFPQQRLLEKIRGHSKSHPYVAVGTEHNSGAALAYRGFISFRIDRGWFYLWPNENTPSWDKYESVLTVPNGVCK